MDGWEEGIALMEGFSEGSEEGWDEGCELGWVLIDGFSDGWEEGSLLGWEEGAADTLGCSLG